MSDTAPIIPTDKPLDIILRPGWQDFENTYIPNKHNTLFRYAKIFLASMSVHICMRVMKGVKIIS